jgi:hypothetical protein
MEVISKRATNKIAASADLREDSNLFRRLTAPLRQQLEAARVRFGFTVVSEVGELPKTDPEVQIA